MSKKETVVSWCVVNPQHPYVAHFNHDARSDQAHCRVGNWDDPQLKLLYHFGMPSDGEMLLLTLPGSGFGPGFDDFAVEFLGVRAEVPPIEGPARTSSSGKFKFYNDGFIDNDPSVPSH